jgi:hypothetical protein
VEHGIDHPALAMACITFVATVDVGADDPSIVGPLSGLPHNSVRRRPTARRWPALMAAPIVGENSIGIRLAGPPQLQTATAEMRRLACRRAGTGSITSDSAGFVAAGTTGVLTKKPP